MKNIQEDTKKNQTPGPEISFHGISYHIPASRSIYKADKSKTTILDNVSGICRPSELFAIMGPTGSGKTTLLDILVGLKNPIWTEGTVVIDGYAMAPNSMYAGAGYVQQQDAVMGTLTVRENIQFAAALRLPASVSKEEKEERVIEVMSQLRLGKVSDQYVGTEMLRGVSGGERKRASIAMALVTRPGMLFLDEPTTGLDASTATLVVELLHKLTMSGKTIVCSIHQPRYKIYKLFDRFSLLSEGRTVYHGRGDEAVQYFANIGYLCETFNNPADFFLDVVQEDERIAEAASPSLSPVSDQNHLEANTAFLSEPLIGESKMEAGSHKSLADRFRDRALEKELEELLSTSENNRKRLEQGTQKKESKSSQYATNLMTQIIIVAQRAAKNAVRNPATSILQVFTTTIFALLVGGIYFDLDQGSNGIQNRAGAFFFITINLVFGNMSALDLFLRERPIFMNEKTNRYYRTMAYFLGKTICDIIPLRLVPIFMFSTITYFMMGLRSSLAHFLIYLLASCMVSLCSASLCFFISTCTDVVSVAALWLSLAYVLFMVAGGLLINLDDLGAWLSWLKYISIFRYGIEIMNVNELHGMEFACDNHQMTPCPSGDDYLETQSFKPGNLWWDIFALGLMFVIYMILAYLLLSRQKKT
mmetsp:Transcript_2744/g.3903  ORF Transcript_2744/g.3903 Transcript_2744/m.3903 type:complete len:647 (+) Transcript_2744:262-2202(+)